MGLQQESYGVIYETTNLINNKTYVGQTITKGNSFEKYLGSGINITRAFKKYGKENFEKVILEYCMDRETLDNSEAFWIDALKPDYNIAEGGRSTSQFGYKLEEEIQNQIDQGIWDKLSEEEALEMANTMNGPGLAPKVKHKRKDSQFANYASNYWDSLSPEERSTRIKEHTHPQSEEMKKKCKTSNIEFYMEHGTFIVLEDSKLKTKQVFYSLRQASRETGLIISFFSRRLEGKPFAVRKEDYKSKKVRYATEEERTNYIEEYYKLKDKNKEK